MGFDPGVFGRFDLVTLVQPHLHFLFVCFMYLISNTPSIGCSRCYGGRSNSRNTWSWKKGQLQQEGKSWDPSGNYLTAEGMAVVLNRVDHDPGVCVCVCVFACEGPEVHSTH